MWLFSIQHIEPVAGVLILLSAQLNSPLSLCFSVLKAFLSHFPRHYPSETPVRRSSLFQIHSNYYNRFSLTQSGSRLRLFDVWMFLKNILVSDCYKKYIHHAPISNIYIQREREREISGQLQYISCLTELSWGNNLKELSPARSSLRKIQLA